MGANGARAHTWARRGRHQLPTVETSAARSVQANRDMGDPQTAAVFLQASRGAWGAVRKVVESGEISKDTQVCCAPR
jgi:hypothetical protein